MNGPYQGELLDSYTHCLSVRKWYTDLPVFRLETNLGVVVTYLHIYFFSETNRDFKIVNIVIGMDKQI